MLRILLVAVSIVGIVLVLGALTSKLYRIPTPSMEPTLHCPKGGGSPGCRGEEADRIAVSRVVYRLRDPEAGDIVAYRLPREAAERCGSPAGATFVHRIRGVPGDALVERSGSVYVNGRRVGPAVRDGSFSRMTIPRDRYLLLGDNAPFSCDSRAWGLLARSRIIGPRIATYWPTDRISFSIG